MSEQLKVGDELDSSQTPEHKRKAVLVVIATDGGTVRVRRIDSGEQFDLSGKHFWVKVKE